MNRGFVRFLVCVAVVMSCLIAGAEANAGWHYRGCCGVPYYGWTGYSYSYYGGWGGADLGCGTSCYTPCYTSCYTPCYSSCYDPCYSGWGCGLLSRLAYRCRSHHYGYYWGCNSCWVAPSCCSVCGYPVDSCGCGGVESGIQYGEPSIVPDQQPSSPTPANPPAGDSNSLPEKQTSLMRQGALLTVNVPQDARVLVNGVATRSTGSLRRYVSRNLTPGFDYTYEVKAEVTVNGKPVVQTKTVQLRAGQQTELAFDMNSPTPMETSLTLHVPADAKVYLAGNQTRGSGAVRTFRTTKLADGQTWSDYVVRVVVDENGASRTKEESITLRAGEEREMTFNFNIDKVAVAR